MLDDSAELAFGARDEPMAKNRARDLLDTKRRGLGIDLIQDGHDSAQQVAAAKVERARHHLRQQRNPHADQRHNRRESDQNVEGFEHRSSTQIIGTGVKTNGRFA